MKRAKEEIRKAEIKLQDARFRSNWADSEALAEANRRRAELDLPPIEK